ncbi:hypothetical protein GCM10010420_12270 [Streptomyces glaucosporus]|uniref:Uncharacterized protein n=1 Tax=Streptomyces glaucosporus TaxID=284044 RepID=A0ABN3HZ31_9ACTN
MTGGLPGAAQDDAFRARQGTGLPHAQPIGYGGDERPPRRGRDRPNHGAQRFRHLRPPHRPRRLWGLDAQEDQAFAVG